MSILFKMSIDMMLIFAQEKDFEAEEMFAIHKKNEFVADAKQGNVESKSTHE